MTAWGQEPGEHKNTPGSSGNASVNRDLNGWLRKFHVGGFDNRPIRFSSKQIRSGQQLLITGFTPRPVVDQYDRRFRFWVGMHHVADLIGPCWRVWQKIA